MSAVEHRIWKILRGEEPPAPCSESLNIMGSEVPEGGGRCRAKYHPSPAMCNPRGFVQGGFVTAMLDDVMAPALLSTCPAETSTPTLEIKTTFIKGVSPEPVEAEAWIIKKTRSVAFMAAELRALNGDLLATASATFRVIAPD